MKSYIITAILCVALIIMIVLNYQKSQQFQVLQQELKLGKETTIVTVRIHDTIHDSIPYPQIVFMKKVKKDTVKIKDSVVVNSDTTTCFEFTKVFPKGTVNVETCSKTFQPNIPDLKINIWMLAVPDSFKTVYRVDTFTLVKTIPEPHKFWKVLGIGAACLGTGYFIAKVTK